MNNHLLSISNINDGNDAIEDYIKLMLIINHVMQKLEVKILPYQAKSCKLAKEFYLGKLELNPDNLAEKLKILESLANSILIKCLVTRHSLPIKDDYDSRLLNSCTASIQSLLNQIDDSLQDNNG
jgi:hypothetical protein